MSVLTYSIVDAFAAVAFRGNGAAVIVLSAPLPDTTLQQIAAEFNLSETAYVTPIDPAKGRFGLRWFTPKAEVALCGHATLASASVLFFGGTYLPDHVKTVEFETVRSGVLTARVLSEGRIELDFPAGEATAVGTVLDQKVKGLVQRAFQVQDGVQPSVKYVGTGDGASYSDYMVIQLNAEYDLEHAIVDPTPFKELAPQHDVIMVTQLGRNGRESFRSRVFGPALGIPEDPVTGSAHSILGPYWAKELQIESRAEMIGRQVSARSGEVGIIFDHQSRVCKLRGNATLVAKGELYLPK